MIDDVDGLVREGSEEGELRVDMARFRVFHETVAGDIVGLARGVVVVLPPQRDARAHYSAEGEFELAGSDAADVYARIVMFGDGFDEGFEVGGGGRDGYGGWWRATAWLLGVGGCCLENVTDFVPRSVRG